MVYGSLDDPPDICIEVFDEDLIVSITSVNVTVVNQNIHIVHYHFYCSSFMAELKINYMLLLLSILFN